MIEIWVWAPAYARKSGLDLYVPAGNMFLILCCIQCALWKYVCVETTFVVYSLSTYIRNILSGPFAIWLVR